MKRKEIKFAKNKNQKIIDLKLDLELQTQRLGQREMIGPKNRDTRSNPNTKFEIHNPTQIPI